jgi:hypothetical protein
MKVLFPPTYFPTPHLETDLELMAEYLAQGHEVYALQCRGELPTCFGNWEHRPAVCLECQGRFDKGMAILGSRVKVIPMPASEAPPEGIPPEFADIDALKNFTWNGAQIGLSAASTLITKHSEHRFDTIAHRESVRREVSTAVRIFRAFKDTAERIKADHGVVFNGRLSTSLPAINACEQLGITYSTHERGGMLNRYWHVQNALPHDIDNATREIAMKWKSMPENDAVRRGAAFFIDRRARVEHSWHSFTKGQTQRQLPPGFDLSQHNISIFNSSIEEYAAVRCWPKPIKIYKDEIDAITQLVESAADDPSIHFYLRIHPNLSGRDNTQTRQLRSLRGRFTNLSVIDAENSVDTYELMEQSAAVITFGSTTGVEACYWGKPSILLANALYENEDCVYRPADHEETMQLIRQRGLPARPQLGALRYGLWDLERGMPFRRFHPDSLMSGTFDGQRVNPRQPLRSLILLLKILEHAAMRLNLRWWI